MQICYIGLIYPDDSKYYEKNINNCFLQTSTSKFCKNQIAGLETVYHQNIKVINLIWLPTYPMYPLEKVEQRYWSHVDGSKDVEIGYRNKRIVKIIDQYIGLNKILDEWILESNEEHVIYACSISVPLLMALYRVKKKYPWVRVCLTIVDLPGRESCESQSGIKGIIKNGMAVIDQFLLRKIDAYVFLTEHMPDKINKKNIKYVVIEGFAASKYEKSEYKGKGNVVLMAGWLSKAFDVEPLLEAFACEEMKEYELWLAGSGDLIEKVTQYSNKYDNIKYLGYVSPQEVKRLQEEATVLINPRRNEHEYIKYSFPGKTFECLASGKPYICYKLDCIPDEYDQYMQYINPYDKDGIKNKVKELLMMSEEERNFLASEAGQWITSCKNPATQCKKIKEMMDDK